MIIVLKHNGFKEWLVNESLVFMYKNLVSSCGLDVNPYFRSVAFLISDDIDYALIRIKY